MCRSAPSTVPVPTRLDLVERLKLTLRESTARAAEEGNAVGASPVDCTHLRGFSLYGVVGVVFVDPDAAVGLVHPRVPGIADER